MVRAIDVRASRIRACRSFLKVAGKRVCSDTLRKQLSVRFKPRSLRAYVEEGASEPDDIVEAA
jgi:hypothetical protein